MSAEKFHQSAAHKTDVVNNKIHCSSMDCLHT